MGLRRLPCFLFALVVSICQAVVVNISRTGQHDFLQICWMQRHHTKRSGAIEISFDHIAHWWFPRNIAHLRYLEIIILRDAKISGKISMLQPTESTCHVRATTTCGCFFSVTSSTVHGPRIVLHLLVVAVMPMTHVTWIAGNVRIQAKDGEDIRRI